MQEVHHLVRFGQDERALRRNPSHHRDGLVRLRAAMGVSVVLQRAIGRINFVSQRCSFVFEDGVICVRTIHQHPVENPSSLGKGFVSIGERFLQPPALFAFHAPPPDFRRAISPNDIPVRSKKKSRTSRADSGLNLRRSILSLMRRCTTY